MNQINTQFSMISTKNIYESKFNYAKSTTKQLSPSKRSAELLSPIKIDLENVNTRPKLSIGKSKSSYNLLSPQTNKKPKIIEKEFQ